MKKEIFDWYASKHLEAFKQVEQGAKFGLSEDQVLSAMEHCYNKIVNEGKKVPDNQIAWYVRNVAKDIDPTDILKTHERIERAENKAEKQKRLFKKLDIDYEKLKKAHAKILIKFNVYKDDAKNKIRSLEEKTIRQSANHLADIRMIREDNDKAVKAKNIEINVLTKSKQSLENDLLKTKENLEFLSKNSGTLGNLLEMSNKKMKVLEREKRSYKRLATFSYILVILSLIQTGLWLL